MFSHIFAKSSDKHLVCFHQGPSIRRERKRQIPIRKSGTIQLTDKPGKGASGVRQYHKVDEEKI